MKTNFKRACSNEKIESSANFLEFIYEKCWEFLLKNEIFRSGFGNYYRLLKLPSTVREARDELKNKMFCR